MYTQQPQTVSYSTGTWHNDQCIVVTWSQVFFWMVTSCDHSAKLLVKRVVTPIRAILKAATGVATLLHSQLAPRSCSVSQALTDLTVWVTCSCNYHQCAISNLQCSIIITQELNFHHPLNSSAPLSLAYHTSKLNGHSSTSLAMHSNDPMTSSLYKVIKMYSAENRCWVIIGNLH